MRPKDTPSVPNPSGLCMCGCGEPTSIAPQTVRATGIVQGAHVRFIKGHHTRIPRSSGYDPFFDPDSDCWKVPLPHGEYSVIDEIDVAIVRKYLWSKTVSGYAQGANGSGLPQLMHRVIMSPPKGVEVDHINGDKLDNRRQNLRLCSNAENQRNTSARRECTSSYKGVNFDKASGRWRARIGINRKTIHIGRYTSEIEAAHAYDNAARKAFGEFARLNFPEE